VYVCVYDGGTASDLLWDAMRTCSTTHTKGSGAQHVWPKVTMPTHTQGANLMHINGHYIGGCTAFLITWHTRVHTRIQPGIHAYIQTDWHPGRHTDIATYRQTHTHPEIHTHTCQPDTQAGTGRYRQIDRQIETLTGPHSSIQPYIHTYTHTYMHVHTGMRTSRHTHRLADIQQAATMYTYIHTYRMAYIYKGRLTIITTNKQLHAAIHTASQTGMQTGIHTHTYRQRDIHTLRRTYIHTERHIGTHTHRRAW